MEVRCKHCCKFLFKGDSTLFNAHHKLKQHAMDVECQMNESDCSSYMIPENVPNWIMEAIDQVSILLIKIFKIYMYMYMKYESRSLFL